MVHSTRKQHFARARTQCSDLRLPCPRRFAGAELGTDASCGLYGRAAHALERRSLTAPRDVGRDVEADPPSRVPLRRRSTAVPRRNGGPRGGHLSRPKNMCYFTSLLSKLAWGPGADVVICWDSG